MVVWKAALKITQRYQLSSMVLAKKTAHGITSQDWLNKCLAHVAMEFYCETLRMYLSIFKPAQISIFFKKKTLSQEECK